MTDKLTHLDEAGNARMVDVGDKPITRRVARARAIVSMAPATATAIRTDQLKKGDALGVARLAGIMAAKRTDALIPLCHGLPLDAVDVRFTIGERSVEIVAEASTSARTGVEMEAMTAASVAALTLYDMAKAIDRGMAFDVTLLFKSGGRSGTWHRDAGSGEPAQSL